MWCLCVCLCLCMALSAWAQERYSSGECVTLHWRCPHRAPHVHRVVSRKIAQYRISEKFSQKTHCRQFATNATFVMAMTSLPGESLSNFCAHEHFVSESHVSWFSVRMRSSSSRVCSGAAKQQAFCLNVALCLACAQCDLNIFQ